MRRRTLLPTTAAAAGLLVARALDGLGLLPWVHEPEQVRHLAADPRWTTLGLLGCLLLGRVAGALTDRAPWLAVAVLVGGQVGIVVGLEEVGRELAGVHEEGGETGLYVACAVQLVLAVLAVTTALLVRRLLPQSLPSLPAVPALSAELPAYRGVVVVGLRSRPRGRAPPVGC